MNVIINLLLLLDFPDSVINCSLAGPILFIPYLLVCFTVVILILLCKFIYKSIKSWKHKHS